MKAVDEIVVRTLPLVPRSIVQRVSQPYIAGPTLGDALAVVAQLNGAGMCATVDVLGEEIHSSAEAEAIAATVGEVLDALRDAGLDANVSVKLTALGLHLDAGLCCRLVEGLAASAAAHGSFVRIDMEDASCTDATLALYRTLRAGGIDNVGIVLQARLHRTLRDVAELADLRPNVRLCKGIYVEPATIAYRESDAIRRSFVACLDALLAGGSYVAVATHDEALLAATLQRVAELGSDAFELQMLLGVREARARELVAAGHRLRVYVPFGQRWYEYSLRRLQENPAMASMIAKATLGRIAGRSA
jgi:proline dehydrogenase